MTAIVILQNLLRTLFIIEYSIKYPYDTGLLLSTCTLVPMFYGCGQLKTNSRRLRNMKRYRRRRTRKVRLVDISNRKMGHYLWRKKHNSYERGNYRTRKVLHEKVVVRLFH